MFNILILFACNKLKSQNPEITFGLSPKKAKKVVLDFVTSWSLLIRLFFNIFLSLSNLLISFYGDLSSYSLVGFTGIVKAEEFL